MKVRIVLLAVSAALAVVPAMAQSTIYSNGPTNGNTDAWTINFGFVVSDTFNVTSYDTQITGASFAMWLEPAGSPAPCAHCTYGGDTLESAELSITSGENSGTTYFNSTVNFTQSGCVVNNYGYDLCQESTSFNGPTLNDGTYWLNLQNAETREGNPVYWDENSGPSHASENSVGTIPSESFTLLGQAHTCGAGADCEASQTVPEPSSIILLGSGMLGLAGVLRRMLF